MVDRGEMQQLRERADSEPRTDFEEAGLEQQP
jgi:hypothetical protein